MLPELAVLMERGVGKLDQRIYDAVKHLRGLEGEHGIHNAIVAAVMAAVEAELAAIAKARGNG